MIEATNFYLFERNVDHARLEDLKAYALIFGVKDEFHETVARLLQMVSPSEIHPSNDIHGAPSVVAFSIASQPNSSAKRKELNEQDNVPAATATFFAWAVFRGYTALVSLLLSEQVIGDVNLWRKPLPDEAYTHGSLGNHMEFIEHSGNEETARLLLETLFETLYRDERESEALFTSARAGYAMVVRLLLRRNETLKNTRTQYGKNALHIAAKSGRDTIVRELLELGWDIEAKGSNGDTPLMAAMRSYSEPTVAVLLENGASVNGENYWGMRTTHAALKSRVSKETVKLILEKAFKAHLPPNLLQPKGKRRRAEVIVTMNRSLYADIFVDSYYASIEKVGQPCYDVTARGGKYKRLISKWNEDDEEICYKFGILFHAYPNTGLDISIKLWNPFRARFPENDERAWSEWKERYENRQIKFQIVNGGQFSLEPKSPRHFLSFEAIATDPNAEIVESDVGLDIDEASDKDLTDDPSGEFDDSDSDLDTQRSPLKRMTEEWALREG